MTVLAEREIVRFLSSTDPEALCLRGKWGVGKTYTWNKLLVRSKEKMALSSYAYVSLFGVGSLDELKYSIFENSVRKQDIGLEPNIATLKANAVGVANALGRKSLWFLQQLPLVRNYVGGLNSLWFFSVSDAVICIDDLERKGANLSVRDVLGLISHLKERKRCKIVLILNDEELADEADQEFKTYLEKVMDISLEFAPSPEDCARIALESGDRAHRLLSKYCIALGISNIRVIKRIERLVRQIEESLAKYDELVFQQAVQSLVLLGSSVYAHDDPFLNFIKTKRGKYFYGTTKGDGLTVEERKWDVALDQYGFTTLDEFDLVLLDGIRQGFFDKRRVRKTASKLDSQFKAAKSNESLEEAWRLYHNSFQDNEAEFVKGILTAFANNIRYVSLPTLDGAVRVLKDLGRTQEAASLINLFMNKRPASREFFDLSRSSFAGDVADEDVLEAVKAKFISFEDKRSPVDILLHISSSKGWSPRDIAALSALSVDDFYRLFKQEDGDRLSRIVETALLFGRLANAEQNLKDISANATEALRKIGGESSLNRRRVRKYGIEPEA